MTANGYVILAYVTGLLLLLGYGAGLLIALSRYAASDDESRRTP